MLVDGAETQLDLVEAGAAAYGVDVTVVLDIIHVVEYVWKAAHVFHREGNPELACWAWTRVRDIQAGRYVRGQNALDPSGPPTKKSRTPGDSRHRRHDVLQHVPYLTEIS